MAKAQETLLAQGLKVKAARGVVCSPLDPRSRIMTVAPEVWAETCKRQGTWYRTSDKAGLHLVVSPWELKGLAPRPSLVLTLSDFSPPRLAEPSDREALLLLPVLKERMPEEWNRSTEMERTIYVRWAQRFGSKIRDFDVLHRMHTANHANFMEPRLWVGTSEGRVPYSIDRTAHLCSSCLEIYGVLGGAYPRRLVAPCPGAVVFARLPADRYLLVEERGNPILEVPLR